MTAPTADEKLALLGMLSHAHAQADAYFDTVGDAAALAAYQVFDTRLAFLEGGGIWTASDIIIDVFLNIALEHGGGDGVQALTYSMTSRALRTRRALLSVAARSPRGEQVAEVYRLAKVSHALDGRSGPGLSARDLQRVESFADAILRLHDPRDLYSDLPFTVTDLSTRLVWHTGRQLPFTEPRYTKLSPLDAPSVAVLDSVTTYITRQRTFNRTLFEHVRDLVMLDLVEAADATALITELGVYTNRLAPRQSLVAAKQQFKLYFEACIWARLLDPLPQIRSRPPLIAAGADVGKSRALTAYLLRRIVNPQTEEPFERSIRSIPPAMSRVRGEETSERSVLDSLLKYFGSLQGAIIDQESRLPEEGRTETRPR